MSQNDINVKYKLNEDGSIKKTASDVKKLGKETENVSNSQENLNKKKNQYNRREKGAAGITSNSTKAFAKQAQTIDGSGGLVPAYATLAANIFALTAAFGVLQRAAQLEQLKEGLSTLANTVGRTSELIVSNIKEITDGAVASSQAFRSAAAGFNAGFSTSEIEGLAKVAKGASIALGRDMTDALDRLVRGTAKLEPEILDELGIFVRLDDAARKYADSLGKSSTQLTQAERRQAFLNTTLQQGQIKFAGIADSVEVNPYDKLAANVDKLATTLSNFFTTVLSPVVSLLANNTVALAGTLVLFASTIKSQMFPVLDNLGQKYAKQAEKATELANTEISAAKELAAVAKSKTKVLNESESAISKTSKFAAIQKKIAAGEKVSVAELIIAKRSLMNSERVRYASLKKYSKEERRNKKRELIAIIRQRKATEELLNTERQLANASTRGAKASKNLGQQQGLDNTITSIQEGGALAGFKEAKQGFKDYNKDIRTTVRTTEFWTKSNSSLGKNLRKLQIGFRAAGVGARLFGAALVNAIPFIGQILFGLGMLVEVLSPLVKKLFEKSKALQELEQVVETASEKVQQLTETNGKLEAQYYEVLLAQEALIDGGRRLTRQRIDEIAKTAETFAEIKGLANTMQVAAGITTEYASAIGSLGEEFTTPIEKAGLFETIVVKAKDAIVDGVLLFPRLLLKALTDSVTLLGDFASYMADILSFEIRYEGDTSKFTNTLDAKRINEKIEQFTSASLKSFDELSEKAPGVSKILEKELGQSMESLVNSELSLARSTEDATEKQKEFELATKRVEARLNEARVKVQEISDGFTKFGDNVREGQTAVSKFSRTLIQDNKFEVLTGQITSVSNAVKGLETFAKSTGQSFGDVLSLKIKEGEIDLKTFGLTAKEVEAKGSEAFTSLIEKATELGEASRNSATKLNTLKAALSFSKQSAQLQMTARNLVEIQSSLEKFGTAELNPGSQLAAQAANYEIRKKQIIAEANLKRDIVEEELRMKQLEIEFQMVLNAGNEAALKKLESMLATTRQLKKERLGLIGVEEGVQSTENDTSNLASTNALKDSILATGSGASTTARNIQNFTESLLGASTEVKSFKDLITNEEGFVSYSKAVDLVTGSLNPMIEKFKELGPDGEIVASIAEGVGMITASFAALGEQIQKSLGTDALDSFESFSGAWDSASFEDKAAVVAAAFSMAAQSIAAISSALSAQSNAAISKIDEQIEQEKKLDGQSAKSVAKLAAMEKKKEQIARKAFATKKALMLAEATMSIAAGIASALSNVITAPLAPLIGALGAVQIALIAGMTYKGGSSASDPSVGSLSVGSRGTSTDLASSRGGAGELSYFRGAQGTGGPENFTPAFTGTKYRASGGETTGFMVGEQGPELFVPEKPGRIVPADEATQGTPINANINISALDAEGVEAVLVRQRGNIIGMIREAANANGETFLESISTSEV